MSFLPEKLQPLFTKEDTYHVHKILGILCLLSFVTRLSMIGESDMGFAKYPEWTLPTVLLHFLLNVSSFGFKIPVKRISSGYRIWPEYRAANICFAAWMLSCMVLYWYEETFQTGPHYGVNLALCLATRFMVDMASSQYGKYQSQTIRELQSPNYVKFCFSLMQIIGTPYFIHAKSRTCSVPFGSIMVLQLNSFLMTLRRKNIAGHYFGIAVYGLGLAIMFVVALRELWSLGPYTAPFVFGLGQVAAFLRMGPIPVDITHNKYVIWTFVGLAINQLRPIMDAQEYSPDLPLTPLQAWLGFALTSAGTAFLGWYKCKYGYRNSPSSKKGEVTTGKVTWSHW